jgi:hypothetical protein
MNAFKKCPLCGRRWHSRNDFLEDPSTDMIGYQVSFEDLSLGLFLFNHLECGTTLGIPAGNFKDLYHGPAFSERLFGTKECQEYCLHEDQLDPCPAKCECAYVREILQTVRRWPKKCSNF